MIKGKLSLMWRVVIAMVLVLSLGLVLAVPVAAITGLSIDSPTNLDPAGLKPPGYMPVTFTFTSDGTETFANADIEIYKGATIIGSKSVSYTGLTVSIEYTKTVDVYVSAVAADGSYDVSVSVANGTGDTVTETDAVIIDRTAPVVTNVEAAPEFVTDADIGSDAFVVTVTFDDVMNQTVNPTIAFEPALTGTLLTSLDEAWTDSHTFTATYDVADVEVDEAGVDITVSDAKNLAGIVQVVDFTEPEAFGVDTENPTLVSAETKTTTTIDATFSEDVDGVVNFGDFSVAGPIGVTAAVESAPGVVTLTLETVIATDATPDVTYTAGTLTDVAGNLAETGTQTPSDGIAPTFTAATDTATSIVVTFSENVDSDLDSADPWSVAGNTVIEVTELDGSGKTMTITLEVPIATDATPDVSYNDADPAADIVDVAVNPLASATVTPSDGMGPVLIWIMWDDVDGSADITEGDALAFGFSEAMDDTSIPFGEVDTRLPTSGSHTYGTLAETDLGWPEANILVVTLGADTNIAPNETVNPDDTVTDLAGNPDATEAPGPAIVQVTVSLEAPPDGLVSPEEAFTVPVNITNITDFDAASYNVMFNSAILELTSVTDGTIDGTIIPVVSTYEVDSGVVRIVENVSGNLGVSGTGTLAELHFTYIGPSGTGSGIGLGNGTLSDKNGNEIYANWFGTGVHASGVLGDANGDGGVNALDITYIERCVSGDPGYPGTPGADANGDGQLNALDITKIERLVAGLD